VSSSHALPPGPDVPAAKRDRLRLADMTYQNVATYLREDDRILIPFGSTEQNGAHLPLGSDTFVAEAIASRAAEVTGVLVGPAIPWGNAAADISYAGTISLAPNTVLALISDLCRSLAAHGFRRLVFVTGHLGNVYALATIGAELGRSGLVLAQVDVWRLLEKLTADLFDGQELPFGHAGASMTSVMLALRPQLVEAAAMRAERPVSGWASDSYASYPEVMGFAPWNQMSTSGAIGNPTMASAAAGQEALARVVARTVEVLDAIRSAPSDA
jgi:creatinine amidohydrolase